MATILEELAIRLGIDQSQVGPNLEQFKDKVNAANSEAKKSFINVGSEGRSFKQLLREISSESPLLGAALKLAFNPIVGLLTVATMAFKHFVEQQKKATEEAERFGKAAAESQTTILEARYSDDPQKERRAAALANAKTNASKPVNDFLTEAKERAKKFFTETELSMWGDRPSPFSDKTLEIANQLHNKAVDRYETLLKENKERENAVASEKQHKEQLDAEEKVAAKLSEAGAIERAGKRESMTAEEKLIDLTSERAELLRKIELGEEDQLKLAERTVDLAKKDQEIAKVKEEIGKRTAQQQKEQAEYSASRNRIEANRDDSFKLDVDKLKTHGQWVYDRKRRRSYWVASAAAQQAQRIDWLENESFNQRAWGNIGGAEDLLKESGRLRSQLVAAKILKPDPADVLLSALDSKKAFKVSVQNLD